MSCIYLWRHRLRGRVGSAFWFKLWAKRLWNLPSLVRVELSSCFWRWRGVRLGWLSSIGCDQLSNCRNLKVGEGSFIGRASIQLLSTVTIGSRVVVNDGVELITGSHDVSDSCFGLVLAPIVIEDYAWIATRAIILPGVTIGRGAVVGAGAVVAKNVLPGMVVVGNPARPISVRRGEFLNYNPNLLRACYEAWVGR